MWQYNHTDELYHYGRKGMRWYQNIFTKGKQAAANLKRKKAASDAQKEEQRKADAAAAIERKRSALLKSRSASEIYENANLFTTQELQAIYSRLQLEANIRNLGPKEVNQGKQFLSNVAETTQKVSNVISKGSEAYNGFAKIVNAFNKGGDKLPLIGADKAEAAKKVAEAAKAAAEAEKAKIATRTAAKTADDIIGQTKANRNKADAEASKAQAEAAKAWTSAYDSARKTAESYSDTKVNNSSSWDDYAYAGESFTSSYASLPAPGLPAPKDDD